MHDLFSASQVQIPWCQTICSVVAFVLALLSERNVESTAVFPPKYIEVPEEAHTYLKVCLKYWRLKPLKHTCVNH